jgi:hypothetical protein
MALNKDGIEVPDAPDTGMATHQGPGAGEAPAAAPAQTDAPAPAPAPATGGSELPPPPAPTAAAPTPAPAPAPGVAGSEFNPSSYAPTAHNATTRDVNAETETVAGQLRGLLDENSPLLQRAQQKGMRAANSRGLMNSTMAASAGTEALMSQAMQIATPDAGTYTAAARDNQSALNQAGQFNAGNKTEADRFKAASENEVMGREQDADIRQRDDERRAEIERQTDERRQGFQQENMQLSSQLNSAAQERMAAITANYSQITQGNAAAMQTLSNMNSGIAQILADPNIPAENKQGLIDRLIESSLRTARLQGGVSGIDLDDVLNFS